jgi:hypothetical protein
MESMMNKWIFKKVFYMYNRIFSAIIGRNPFIAAMWMKQEHTVPNEISHGEKDKQHLFSLICES